MNRVLDFTSVFPHVRLKASILTFFTMYLSDFVHERDNATRQFDKVLCCVVPILSSSASISLALSIKFNLTYLCELAHIEEKIDQCLGRDWCIRNEINQWFELVCRVVESIKPTMEHSIRVILFIFI